MGTPKHRTRTGRYTFENQWERLCVCGRTLGVHDGEAPHAFGDLVLDPRPGLPDCARFRPARKKPTNSDASK